MPRFARTAALVALWAWAVAATWSSLDVFAVNLQTRDFTAFYRSAQTWMTDGDLYQPESIANVNINPPHVSVLLFVPLLLWQLPAAAVVWLAINAVAGGAALSIVQRELRIPAHRFAWMLPLFLASSAVQHQWREGQVAGLLLLLGTVAWRSARRERPGASPWSAAVITLKPWLVSWLPLLRGRGLAWAVAVGLGGIAIGVALLGWTTWSEWAETLRAKPVRPNVINLSLLAAFSRFLGMTLENTGGWPYGQPLWLVLVGITLALTWSARHGSVDRAWLLFGLAGLLVSPLGWAYYLVAVTGPLIAWGETHRWPRPALAGVGFLMFTREFMEWIAVGPTAAVGGSFAFFGVLLIWGTVLADRSDAAPRYDSFSPVLIR
jgi:hypothetical protein